MAFEPANQKAAHAERSRTMRMPMLPRDDGKLTVLWHDALSVVAVVNMSALVVASLLWP